MGGHFDTNTIFGVGILINYATYIYLYQSIFKK